LLKFVVIQNSTGLSETFRAANVLHMKLNNPSEMTLAFMTTYLASAGAAFETRFKPQRSTSWSTVQYQLIALDGSALQVVQTALVPGTAASLPLAPGLSVAVSWASAAYWRGGKFRTYMAGIPINAIAATGDAQITATYAGNLRTAANGFLGDINALTAFPTGAGLGGVSYYSRYAFRPTPLFLTFAGAHVHERLDSQRRRNGKETAAPAV
jgi:hypothetical protein